MRIEHLITCFIHSTAEGFPQNLDSSLHLCLAHFFEFIANYILVLVPFRGNNLEVLIFKVQNKGVVSINCIHDIPVFERFNNFNIA